MNPNMWPRRPLADGLPVRLSSFSICRTTSSPTNLCPSSLQWAYRRNGNNDKGSAVCRKRCVHVHDMKIEPNLATPRTCSLGLCSPVQECGSAPMLEIHEYNSPAPRTGCVTSFRENPLEQLKIFPKQRSSPERRRCSNSSAGKPLFCWAPFMKILAVLWRRCCSFGLLSWNWAATFAISLHQCRPSSAWVNFGLSLK